MHLHWQNKPPEAKNLDDRNGLRNMKALCAILRFQFQFMANMDT